MSEKELKMFDVDAQLDAVFGKEGTPERKAAEDRANAFFTGQIIEEARKKAKMTQEELAKKIGTNKSYISRVETGKTEPKVTMSGIAVDMRSCACRRGHCRKRPKRRTVSLYAQFS